MTYQFYVQMDGEVFGPYTVRELMGLGLLDDTLLTEESMNGEWLPACRFDFNDMLRKEEPAPAPNTGMTSAYTPPQPQYIPPQPQSGYANYQQTIVNTPSPAAQPQVHIHAAESYPQQPLPYNIHSWNWGAFQFSWIWGVFNGQAWTLLIILINFIPILGQFVSLGFSFYLGAKGNKLAWERKEWRDTAHFERVQHNWSVAGLIAFLLSIVLGIVVFLVSLHS